MPRKPSLALPGHSEGQQLDLPDAQGVKLGPTIRLCEEGRVKSHLRVLRSIIVYRRVASSCAREPLGGLIICL